MKPNRRNHSEFNDTSIEEEPTLYKPSPEEIAERAHSHFEAGGSEHGNHNEHWLTAEADLLAERNI